jgi:hypothetical protein
VSLLDYRRTNSLGLAAPNAVFALYWPRYSGEAIPHPRPNRPSSTAVRKPTQKPPKTALAGRHQSRPARHQPPQAIQESAKSGAVRRPEHTTATTCQRRTAAQRDTTPRTNPPRDQEQRRSPARGSTTNNSATLNHRFPLQRETKERPAPMCRPFFLLRGRLIWFDVKLFYGGDDLSNVRKALGCVMRRALLDELCRFAVAGEE